MGIWRVTLNKEYYRLSEPLLEYFNPGKYGDFCISIVLSGVNLCELFKFLILFLEVSV